MPKTGEGQGTQEQIEDLNTRLGEVPAQIKDSHDALMTALTGTHSQLKAMFKELLDVLVEREQITVEERDRVMRAAPKNYR